MSREEQPKETFTAAPYQAAVLPAEIGHQEIHLHAIGRLAGWVQAVVNVESPVHFDEMARRITEAGGVSKVPLGPSEAGSPRCSRWRR